MSPLADRIRSRWPDLQGPGVVAVSGGADSVALLRTLAEWVQPLIVAHLNHRLRGPDSDGDEQFVGDLAFSLQLPFRSHRVDVRAEAQGDNLEDVARRLRYDWLAEVARETGSNWIATGHTADDQAETVLHRLIRGAGIQGLRGIAAERELAVGICLIRPLLPCSRSMIIAHLESIGQNWREDATNRDPAFTRNRIRHELLPLLRTFNPAIVDVLGRVAEQAGELYADEEAEAQTLLSAAELPRAGDLCIFDLKKLRTSAPHRVRSMFRLLWRREGWPLRDMTYEHWKRLVAVALNDAGAIDLPGKVAARRQGSVLQLGATSKNSSGLDTMSDTT